MSRPFKMTCNSNKCIGSRPEKYIVKSDNKFIRDCPDCGCVLFQDFGGHAKIKDRKEHRRTGANYGLRKTPKDYLG